MKKRAGSFTQISKGLMIASASVAENLMPLRSISVCVWMFGLPVSARRRAERCSKMVVGCVSGKKKKNRRNTGAAIHRSSHCDLWICDQHETTRSAHHELLKERDIPAPI